MTWKMRTFGATQQVTSTPLCSKRAQPTIFCLSGLSRLVRVASPSLSNLSAKNQDRHIKQIWCRYFVAQSRKNRLAALRHAEAKQ